MQRLMLAVSRRRPLVSPPRPTRSGPHASPPPVVALGAQRPLDRRARHLRRRRRRQHQHLQRPRRRRRGGLPGHPAAPGLCRASTSPSRRSTSRGSRATSASLTSRRAPGSASRSRAASDALRRRLGGPSEPRARRWTTSTRERARISRCRGWRSGRAAECSCSCRPSLALDGGVSVGVGRMGNIKVDGQRQDWGTPERTTTTRLRFGANWYP